MNIGLDVGYSEVKAVTGKRRARFPSVIGDVQRARFSLNDIGGIILTEPEPVLIGAGAIEQSRFLRRREDRAWIHSDEWYYLALAALTELTNASAEMIIVTGLPVSFYDDKDTPRARLLGEHRTARDARRAQLFRVLDVRVIPQPFGALLAASLDDHGRIRDQALATGAVGVIDVGGKTTNLLSVNRLSEISKETASVSVGAWDVARAVRTHLDTVCPNLDLEDHEVMNAVQARQAKYYGEPVDLTPVIDAALAPMTEKVIAEATQLWNGAAGLDTILVTGGGALLLGPELCNHFPHAQIVPEPLWANALGFWRFAQRLASKEQ